MSGYKRVVKKVLIYRPTGEEVNSYNFIESKIFPLGWERCNPSGFEVREYCLPTGSSRNVMALPAEFKDLNPIKMYEISVQTRTTFEVREVVEML